MRILAIISGEYGQRHVDNIREHGPQNWTIDVWQAPGILPPIVDYPEDYVPDDLPPADLVLSFAENKGVAELLIRKQRNGPVGMVKLAFLGQYTRFENLAFDQYGGEFE